MTREEAKHTCGRCQYENVPDQEYPCNRCIWNKDVRQDLWTPKENPKYKVRIKMANKIYRTFKVGGDPTRIAFLADDLSNTVNTMQASGWTIERIDSINNTRAWDHTKKEYASTTEYIIIAYCNTYGAKTESEQEPVLDKVKAEIKEWYWQADKQALAKDPCVVDAMIDLFIRTINKYKSESEV